jgi:hypothetical protein
MVTGQTQNLGKNRLWVVVKPLEAGYYPQTGPVPVAIDGRWSVLCYIGAPGSLPNPQQFQLLIVAAPPSANSALIKYRQDSEAKGKFEDMPSLPDDAMIMTSMDVIRQQ